MDFRELVSAPNPNPATRIIRVLLRLPAGLYWLAAQAKNWIYDWHLKSATQSGLPTISVGNLSVGGTGKSPVVAWLARELRNRKLRVAILSRGYHELQSGMNDEALELEQLLPDVPHLQHWDRIASAKVARDELDMQCLVLDDAFQHRRIARDLDIVLLDATDSASAQHVLPAGLYREPLSNLRRADMIILTRADQVPRAKIDRLRAKIKRHADHSLVVEATHKPQDLYRFPGETLDHHSLRDARVLAFCGIGNPNAFFTALESLGATIVDRMIWPDHHDYTQGDVAQMQKWAAGFPEVAWVVCTMKDSVKLQSAVLDGRPLVALRISLGLSSGDQEKLRGAVEQMLAQREHPSEEEG